MLASFSSAAGIPFAGGTGESNDPYQIATAAQLIAIGSDPNFMMAHHVLVTDIDLNPGLPGGQVFQQSLVYGTRGKTLLAFEGTFDGGGHTIRNGVFLVSSATSYYGSVFGTVGPKGLVRNLHIVNTLLAYNSSYGTQYGGGLAGSNQGVIADCSCTGTLTLAGSTSGGLVGSNEGIIVNCHSDCEVFANTVGGLVGSNAASGRIISCSAGGTIVGTTYSGGLVGQNAGTIQYGSAEGLLNGGGGLVGYNTGTVRESHAAAFQSSGGGLANANYGTIVNCYTTPPASSKQTDGLVVAGSGVILTSYSTKPSQVRYASGSTASRSGGTGNASSLQDRYVYYLDANKPSGQTTNPFVNTGVALTDAEMRQAASFVGFDFHGDPNDGGTGPWFMPPDGYPVLSWQTPLTGLVGIPDISNLDIEKAKRLLEYMGVLPGSVTYDYSRLVPVGRTLRTQPLGCLAPASSADLIVSLGPYSFDLNPGDGSEAKPYQIATASQFESFYGQSALWDKHLALTADIDLNWYEYPSSTPYTFAGEFNGNGHTLRNLRILAISPTLYCPLFGTIASTGSVHDLNIEQPRLYASYGTIGLLAGTNNGQLSRCRTTGNISSSASTAGGLVGRNTGQITECSFSGRIESPGGTVGGLTGYNTGSILRCLARGVDVTGGVSVGGLVGDSRFTLAAGSTIEASYATGTVTGTGRVGGLIGSLGSYAATQRRLCRTARVPGGSSSVLCHLLRHGPIRGGRRCGSPGHPRRPAGIVLLPRPQRRRRPRQQRGHPAHVRTDEASDQLPGLGLRRHLDDLRGAGLSAAEMGQCRLQQVRRS